MSLFQKFFSKLALPMQPATNANHLSPDLSKVCLAEAFDFKDTSVQYWSIIPPGRWVKEAPVTLCAQGSQDSCYVTCFSPKAHTADTEYL